MEKLQYIIVLDGSLYKSMYEHMLDDLSDMNNVTFIIDNPHKCRIKKLILKRKIQEITNGAFDWIAYEKNNLYNTIDYLYQKGNNKVCVVFLNASLNYSPYTAGTLKKYKQKYSDLKYVLFYLDIMNIGVSFNADYLRERDIFDLVYTIDQNDALKTKTLLWRTFYSEKNKYKKINMERDMYFCGVSKGRENLLIQCVKEARKNNIDVLMDIIPNNNRKKLEKYVPNIRVRGENDYLSYSEVLINELESRCILEVVQRGQMALTLRPYEAVVYNRKLLTNNKSIFNFPYYNENFMHYFEQIEDIDWNWVKSDIEVNYKYNGEFSPKYLLENIEMYLKGETK